jgi:Kef-type K+ transport system membrane component KefB
MSIAGIVPFCVATMAGASAPETAAVGDMAARMQLLILQIAIILIVSRIGGSLFHKLFGLPGVLGELAAGMVIGPYALGKYALPWIGPLFPPHPGGLIPVSPELYGMATLASLLLLFLSGLETDLGMFLRYSTAGTAVGIGGVVVSFALGELCAIWFGLADSWLHPTALFLGAVSTATSVGITARILTERRKTDSPEGVTILAGAVLDDVLGIMVLAIVLAMTKVALTHETIHWGHIAWLSAKTFGFWITCTVLGIVSARWLSRQLKRLGSADIIASFSLGLALLLAGLVETVGLAMIIGAYIMGLSLSRTDLVHVIQHQLRGAYNMFVPVFFCVMGMLMNFAAMKSVVLVGLVYSVVAILAKIVGCGVPAWLMHFNVRGAYRIGIGMVPRGEVALIVAGIGLSSGAIQDDVFGVAIMMTVLSSVIAPPLLVKAFHGGPGVRGKHLEVEQAGETITLDFPTPDVADFVFGRIARAFQNEEFFVYLLGQEPPTYQIRKDAMVFTLVQDEKQITLTSNSKRDFVGRFIVLEEILGLKDLADSVQHIADPGSMGSKLLGDLFVDDD